MHGQAAVREYRIRQWAEIDPHVEPLTIVMRSDDRVAVEVRQIVRTLDGAVISDCHVIHVYEMSGGLVARMDVEEPQTRN